MEITSKNAESTTQEGVVLLDFWAPWCGPCKILGPIVDRIEADNPEIVVGKVNVDENAELAREYGVRGIPMLAYLKGGEIIKTMVGVQSQVAIQKDLDELV